MAGRGRAATSLTHEQMASLGLMGMKDMSQSITAPPPIFPPLMSKPVPLETGAGRDFKILWKEDFISFLKDSPYFSHPQSDTDSKIQRYSDKYVQVLTNPKRDKSSKDFEWQHFPSELRPNWKRKTSAATTTSGRDSKKANLSKPINLEDKLKLLEEKELGSAAKESIDPANAKASNDSEDDDEELAEDEQDEEMDEDNDYGNSYFDNGDAYNEEDDNLDDGPVY